MEPMPDAPIELLAQIPLFEGLPQADLGRIARSFKERRFSAGDTIAVEGASGIGFAAAPGITSRGNCTWRFFQDS